VFENRRGEGKCCSREERTCPNIRTRPHGRVLMFETGGRYPNNRTCPCGLVLLFEMRRDVGNMFFVFGTLGGGNGEGKREGSCQTPKTRPYAGVLWLFGAMWGEGVGA